MLRSRCGGLRFCRLLPLSAETDTVRSDRVQVSSTYKTRGKIGEVDSRGAKISLGGEPLTPPGSELDCLCTEAG
eukprot:750654-Hanusia_phi.AAC.2